MKSSVNTPFLGANDSEANLVKWGFTNGDQVKIGDEICLLETTKAIVEVQAEVAGYIYHIVDEGQSVEVNQLLAVISDQNNFDVDTFAQNNETLIDCTPTRKAQILMSRNAISAEEIRTFANGERINESIVNRFLEQRNTIDRRIGINGTLRVAIVGGCSGGGALIVLDAISRLQDLIAVAIYDREQSFQNKAILGVPVVGTIAQLESDYENGNVDAVVLAFNRNLQERHQVFTDFCEKGYEFVNIIDRDADIRSNVAIGRGNVILGHSYFGACSEIGDNNFISANVALEHGNKLGSSCAFGPGVFTSGNVVVGDRVRFGTGVFVEPALSIGDDAIIGSGQTIVTNIPPSKKLIASARA